MFRSRAIEAGERPSENSLKIRIRIFDDASFDAVFAANVLHLVLVVPTYLHRETFGAAMLSRLFSITGFPGRRRFTATSLALAVERAGFQLQGRETISGPFPIGCVVATR